MTALCECGCGGVAPISPHTSRPKGYVAGAPRRFLQGHNNRRPEVDRFMSKIVWNGDGDECWTWEGSRDRGGYGRFHRGSRADGSNRTAIAHRAAYEMFVGVIPSGLALDHLCRNRACVNPDHLEPVPHAENVKRGNGPSIAGARQAVKTHCPQGHPYSGENLYTNARGERFCRECRRAAVRRWREKAKAGIPLDVPADEKTGDRVRV